MKSSLSLRLRSLFLVALIGVLTCTQATGQTARVQFVNASTYAGADTIDVFLNGRLLLDDFASKTGKPFRDYPAGVPLTLEVRRGGATEDANSFYSETLTLTPGESYFAIAAGDPEKRRGQPPFKFFVRAGAPEGSDDPGYVTTVVFNNDPRGAVTNVVRGVGEQSDYARYHAYGEFSGILPAAKMRWDVDCIQAGNDSVIHIAPDFTRFGRRSVVNIGFCSFGVLSDGSTWIAREEMNVAHLQFVHIASDPGTRYLNVSIDSRVVADSLPAGSATAFLEVPSGIREDTAPEIRIEVRAAGAVDEEPLYVLEQEFLFGHRYVSVLADNPDDEAGTQTVGLHVTDLGADSILHREGAGITVFNGAAGTRSITLGMGEPTIVPLTERILFGAFETGIPRPRVDTTVVVLDGDSRRLLASFEVNLARMGLVDSSLVLLTSTGLSTETERQTLSGGIALMAALPSGGKLIAFEGSSPPPWWQNPWLLLLLLAGAVGVAFVGSQVRVRRLEARSRELERTVQQRTQELLAEKDKTEEQARRLAELDEAKNRFFANISHEFRTPLTLILGPMQDAIDGQLGPVGNELHRQHRLVQRNARRLLRLVNQLLDLSRLESGQMELHREAGELIGFAKEIVRGLVPLAERRRIDVAFHSEVEELPALFDPDAVEKILVNLISNALKFSPEQSQVSVEARLTGTSESQAIVVSVTDAGPGIPEEQLDRIFERFQQGDTSTRRRHEGSGIGLTLARDLAELHGGTLAVESVVGEGSRFEVTLPVERPDSTMLSDRAVREDSLLEDVADAADGLPSESDGQVRELPTILVVEDNAEVREYLRAHLARDYHIIEAEDGALGLKAAQEHEPDLVLSDVMMPTMDGYEMCRLIKANEGLRHIPIVMLTAKASERDTIEGLQSGADDYLEKPFSVAELTARVSNLISTRRELHEAFSREIFVRPADIEITPEEEEFLDRLLDTINTHLGDANLTIDWLADDMGFSRRQLERRVEAVTGKTPAALVRRFRLERASQLLRANAGTVSEISYAVGFRSAAHFAKAFRQAFGESPSEHVLRFAKSQGA